MVSLVFLTFFYTPLLRPLSKTSEQPKRKALHCVREELTPHAWLGTNAWSLFNHHCSPSSTFQSKAKGQALAVDTPERPGKPTDQSALVLFHATLNLRNKV